MDKIDYGEMMLFTEREQKPITVLLKSTMSSITGIVWRYDEDSILILEVSDHCKNASSYQLTGRKCYINRGDIISIDTESKEGILVVCSNATISIQEFPTKEYDSYDSPFVAYSPQNL